MRGPRTRAAAVSIGSNAALILLKLIAGAVTGSVAILTEAIHSSVDLIASLIAFFSVRQAEEPADEGHRYGHEKFENVAAAAEGVLILVGSGVIVYAAVRSLVQGPELDSLGFGIAVLAFSTAANFAVSTWLYARARATQSAALEGDAAHLRTDAYTSGGVLVGLGLVHVPVLHAARHAGLRPFQVRPQENGPSIGYRFGAFVPYLLLERMRPSTGAAS